MKNVSEIMFRWCLTYDAVYILEQDEGRVYEDFFKLIRPGTFLLTVYGRYREGHKKQPIPSIKRKRKPLRTKTISTAEKNQLSLPQTRQLIR